MSKTWQRITPFLQKIQFLMERSQIFPGMHLHVDLVVNPKAGAFTRFFQRRRWLKALETEVQRHQQKPPRPITFKTYRTQFAGHEKDVLQHLLRGDPADYKTDRRIVIVAGGDGTSKGVFEAFETLSPETRANSFLFRLPLGTGNDAADAPTMEQAFQILLESGIPKATERVRLQAPGIFDHLGYNISSIGLDAFVVVMTNAFKKVLPGNTYSLMVDVATLLYEILVGLKDGVLRRVHLGQTQEYRGGFLLAAFGAGGRRVYGAGKRVLPGDENLCWAERQKLLTKLSYRKPFYLGTHGALPGIHLEPCSILEVDYPGRLPVQLDGESFWLEKENFPMRFLLEPSGLLVLRAP